MWWHKTPSIHFLYEVAFYFEKRFLESGILKLMSNLNLKRVREDCRRSWTSLPPCTACSRRLWFWRWSRPAGRWCRSRTAWCCPSGPEGCLKALCLQREQSSRSTASHSNSWTCGVLSPLCIIFKFSFKWFSAFTVWGRQTEVQENPQKTSQCDRNEKLTANVIFPNISSGITSSNEQYTNL